VSLTQYGTDRGIATITLDSPHNRNALSAELIAEVTAQLDVATADDTIRAVVLTHTGSTFCAGMDMREMSAEGGPQGGTARLLGLLRKVIDTPKPVIGRIDGHVRAGGVGLVGACDVVLGGTGATFAYSEVRLGLAPAIISLTTLTRVHERAAARYCLTGESFDARTAERIGLITEFATDLDAALGVLLDALRACSPQGLAETKPLTTARVRAEVDERGAQMQALSARLFASDDAGEGMQAFLQKRSPRWASA